MQEKTNMTKEEKITAAETAAGQYFKEGMNCAECVLQSFLDTHNVICQKKL